MKLGEVMTIVRGASPRPIQQYLTSDKNGIHWIKIGDVNPNSKYIEKTEEFITIEGANKSRYLEKGSFVLSNSMSFGRPYILSISGCIHDGWISMVHYEQSFNQDFLYHLLRSDMIQKYWKMKASSGTVSNLNADIVRSTVVPIPSIEKQIEIASVLDKLSSLTTDLASGLPAEIKARQQQYEYHRDTLLSFPRKSSNS